MAKQVIAAVIINIIVRCSGQHNEQVVGSGGGGEVHGRSVG